MAFNQTQQTAGGFRPSMYRPKPSTVIAEKQNEYQQNMTNSQPGQQPFQSNRSRKKNKNKQKDEARESIASYESKKQNDPNFKDLKLSTFATEWIEIVRKNITGDLTDFETDLSAKIIRALVFKEDVQMLDSSIKKELADSAHGGILLATALRLLKTSSSTQKMKDFSMTRLTEEIPNMEIPNFLNVVLSNVGKFSDDTFGNFRINSPVTTAKNRILKAMSTTKDHLSDSFVTQRDKKTELINNILTQPNRLYIYQDSDALDMLKSYSKMYYEDSLRHINLVVKNQQQQPLYYFSLPFIDFERVSKADQIAYLKKVAQITEIQNISVDNAASLPTKLQTVKGLRDACAACVVFQNLNESFLDDVTIALKDYDSRFDDTAIAFISDTEIKTILDYLEFIYIGDILTVKDIIKNARIVYNFYIDRSLPYIKKNFKVSTLSNSEFGTRAQLIEKKNQEYDTDRVEFSAISKFKENDLNVLGGLFGFVRNIKFKRAISQTLSASSDTILSSMVKNDLKY
jgi:ribosomal protein S18